MYDEFSKGAEESADDAGEDGEWKKARRWRCPFAEASEESAGERAVVVEQVVRLEVQVLLVQVEVLVLQVQVVQVEQVVLAEQVVQVEVVVLKDIREDKVLKVQQVLKVIKEFKVQLIISQYQHHLQVVQVLETCGGIVMMVD